MGIENKITENGDCMKNDLTAEEWLALAFFLSGESLILSGRSDGKVKRIQAFQRAKDKVIETAKDIQDVNGHYEAGQYVKNIPDDERWAGELD